ncbi:MAG: HNH endonuclease signature motif containing protein [Vicinamibacteria bacterium]
MSDESRSLWDADHIIPVIEGGGGCGLDNYRTLCVACHRGETSGLATRRAERRRAQRPLFPLAAEGADSNEPKGKPPTKRRRRPGTTDSRA